MTPADYERFRQQLETQLRSDVELIYEAYRAKLRAFETVLRARGEFQEGTWEPPAALSLPAAASLPSLPAAAERVAAPPPAVAVPAARPAPAPPPRKKAAPAFTLYNDLFDLLEGDRVGETFDKKDLAGALGYEPPRATLHRAVQDLASEGVIVVVEYGLGRNGTSYRRTRKPAVPIDSVGET